MMLHFIERYRALRFLASVFTQNGHAMKPTGAEKLCMHNLLHHAGDSGYRVARPQA